MVTASLIVVIISTMCGASLVTKPQLQITRSSRTTTTRISAGGRITPTLSRSSLVHRFNRPSLIYHRYHNPRMRVQNLITRKPASYINKSNSRCTLKPTKAIHRTVHNIKKSRNRSKVHCGIDNSPHDRVMEGPADIEYYPWLGILLYPYDSPHRSLTTVILVSQQAAITSALDIDYYPKEDFRSRSRVILGHNCTDPPFIRVIDYTFHPDFARSTFSTLALVQLDTRPYKIHVFPICGPQREFDSSNGIYAMSLSLDSAGCVNSTMVNVYKMVLVDMKECQKFYKKADLNLASMWSKHMACGRAITGEHCVWRSGTALVIREGQQWRLLGVGVYGPGCHSPARFIEYSRHRLWVEQVKQKAGRPAVTRLSPSCVVLRRTLGNVQRFGPCSAEETKMAIVSDSYPIVPPLSTSGLLGYQETKVNYNVTLLKNVNYHCIIFQVANHGNSFPLPEVSMQRYCSSKRNCDDLLTMNIYFFVTVKCRYPCLFTVSAYGADDKYLTAMNMLANGYQIQPYP